MVPNLNKSKHHLTLDEQISYSLDFNLCTFLTFQSKLELNMSENMKYYKKKITLITAWKQHTEFNMSFTSMRYGKSNLQMLYPIMISGST